MIRNDFGKTTGSTTEPADAGETIRQLRAQLEAAKRLRSACDRQRNSPRGVSVEVHDAIQAFDAAMKGPTP